MDFASTETAFMQALSSIGQPRPPSQLGARIWRCPQCSRAFKKKGHLERHTQSHTKQKPFRCDYCPKAYSRRDSLVRHERIHTCLRSSPWIRTNGNAGQSSPVSSSRIQEEGRCPASSDGHYNLVPSTSRTLVLPTTSGHSQSSPSTCESLMNDAEPPIYDSAPFSADSHPRHLDSTLAEPTDPTYTQLHGPIDTDPLFLYEQFNLEALELAVLESGHLAGSSDEQFFDATHLVADAAVAGQAVKGSSGAAKRQTDVHKAVHSRWYTRPILQLSTLQPLIGPVDQDEVDEEYRAGLSERLAPIPNDIALPSADFLNLCVKLYFAKFQPLFPIIHPASFRPTSDRALVLLSMCSIGALFVGSDTATRCGRAIFLKLNKAILASWERYVHQGGREALAVAQAATLGQTYGILSGQPHDLLLTDSFHGTVIAWVRQAGLFKVRTAFPPANALDVNDVENSWRLWAQREETVRLVLALQIHDSEFTKIFHHEGLLRHDDKNALPACCSAELFAATTASKWHDIVVASTPQSASASVRPVPGVSSQSDTAYRDRFHAYAKLAGHHAHLIKARCSDSFDDEATTIRQRLASCYVDIAGSTTYPSLDQFSLLELWHQTFMAFYVDFDLVESIIGRDGMPPISSEEDKVRRWVRSDDGIRCALHATLIMKRHSKRAISAGSAIHVPLALFRAGAVIYCCIKFAEPATQRKVKVVELDHTELSAAHVMEQMSPKALCNVADILRRHGHWELSRRFASILDVLVEDLTT